MTFEPGDRVCIRDTHPGPGWRGQKGTVLTVPGDVLNPEHTTEPSTTYSMTFDGRPGRFAGISGGDLERIA